MTNDTLIMAMVNFQDKNDTTPQPWKGTWGQFRKRLTSHVVRPEKDGKLWSPTVYKTGTTRRNENVVDITAAVGDFDSGATYDEILPRISSFEHLAHSTHSHTPQHPKFRVVLPFKSAVPAAEWPSIKARIDEHVFGMATDAGTKDPARMYYLPSCPPKTERFAKHHRGEVLDPYTLPPASAAIVQGNGHAGTEKGAAKVPLGKAALDFVANGAPITTQRSRAIAAARNYLSAGYSEKDTAEAIWRGLQVSRPDPTKEPWTKDEAIAMVLDLASKPAPPLPVAQKAEGRQAPKVEKLAPLKVVCLADVQPEAVTWLWRPYLPFGKVTCLEGDPGLGKSWLSLAIATGVSLGKGLPGMQPATPATVLILTAEDGLADTVRPRLDAMGADVTRVYALEGPLVLDEAGLEEVEKHIAAMRPALVVYDPLVAYLGAGVDLHRSNETREVMAALARLAEKYGCAILVIRHLTKGGRDKAIYRGIGSIDITAACRSVLLAGCDPQDSKKRAIVQTKSNLAEFGPAVGYEIREGSFFWTGASDLTASRILAPEATEDGKSALQEAVDFLQDALADGDRPVSDVQKEAKAAGIKEMTLDRAKAQLGVRAKRRNKSGGKRGEGEWVWGLPSGDDVQEGQNVQGCQNSIVENLTPLKGPERKQPSNGQGLDTLERLADPWDVAP